MNRRGFLGAIVGVAALPIASALPVLPVTKISGMSLLNKYFSPTRRYSILGDPCHRALQREYNMRVSRMLQAL